MSVVCRMPDRLPSGWRRGLLLAVLLPVVVCSAAVFQEATAEAAPLVIRIGLVSGRWAVDVSGLPGPGLRLSGRSGWPGKEEPATAGIEDGGRFAVCAATERIAAVSTDNLWLARAAGTGLARTGGPVAETDQLGGWGPARLGGLWYVLYGSSLEGDLEQSCLVLRERTLPAFILLWPCVPALGGRTERPCLVPLAGARSGLVFSAAVPLTLVAGGGLPRVGHVAREYRGSLEVLPSGGATLFSLVNVVDIEDYLLGVVPSEMPASWPLEALKAQAVAARTYAVRNLGKHRASGFDLCDEIHCQAYLGYANEYPGPTAAVRATAGTVATYGGRPINAFYHAHAGGATDSSAVIWGAAEPYLVGTSQTYERPYPWTTTNRRTEVEQAVAAITGGEVEEGLFPLLSATPGDFTPGGRARTVAFTGPATGSMINAERLRSMLGTYSLRSGAFSARQVQTIWLWTDTPAVAGIPGLAGGGGPVQAVTWAPGGRGSAVIVLSQGSQSEAAGVPLGLLSPEFFVFSGEGFGHGVGMSQWGAREMAAAGMNHAQILTQFYRGITLSANYAR